MMILNSQKILRIFLGSFFFLVHFPFIFPFGFSSYHIFSNISFLISALFKHIIYFNVTGISRRRSVAEIHDTIFICPRVHGISMQQQYERLIDRAAKLAAEYELKYFGCSQTTLAGLIEAFGIGGPDLLRSSTCLAGGIARRGHVCGALTGGLMMIGFLTGRDDLEMFPQYQRSMEYGNRLYCKFQEAYGTVSCSEIQNLQFGRTYNLQDPKEREELHKRMAESGAGCQSVTGAGARMTAEIMVDIFKQGLLFPGMLAQVK